MKHIAIFILLLMVSKLSLSQSKVGVVVFPQISSLSNADLKTDSVNKNLLTLSGGAGITYTNYLSKKVSIQTGLFYSSQNQKFKSSYHSKDGSFSVEVAGKKRFDYLKVPILMRYSISAGEKLTIVPFAGLQLSYLLKYDGGMVVYGDNYFDMPATPKGNDFYKKTVFDIPLGLNIEYAVTERIELVFGGKVDYALTNAANNNAQYLGAPITSYGGISDQKQQAMTYGVNLGMAFSINKKEKRTPSPTPEPAKGPMLAENKEEHKTASTHHHTHHRKDTVSLEGKHHHRHHHHSHHTAVASSNRDHVGEMFNKSYVSLIKGVVYKKGTNEILNNTKIILETEESKIDSSITAIGGMYTLHVRDRSAKHQMYVYRKGYKPLLIDIPDTLVEKNLITVVKIQLEPDGSDHEEEKVVIVLTGKVMSAQGNAIQGASIEIRNNIDKTTRKITCDANGQYMLELKKYSHYTVSASKGNCVSEKVNKSTISIKESAMLEQDLVITCP